MDFERPFKCKFPECDKSYKNNAHLKRHMEVHSLSSTTYICKLCSANISTQSNLKRHYNRVHNHNRLYCHDCKKSFRKKNVYEEHMASHENYTMHECTVCGKRFMNHLRLKKHLLSHEPRNYKCPYEGCSQIFDFFPLLQAHKKTHTEFSCDHCGKVFSKRCILQTHLKIHLEDRPAIVCPHENCNRMYYFKKNLKQHIHTAHSGGKFECDICKRKLASKQKIKEHIMKIHLSNKKPFKRKAPSQRKDSGLAKKSMLSALTGIQLSVNAEVLLMQRAPVALQRDKLVEENSFSEDDRASDFSAKGA